jgi:hypothetical protein
MTRISTAVQDARPALARDAVIAAVLAAQLDHGQPVTSEQARAYGPPLESTARRWTSLARRVAALGPDPRGRQLVEAGVNHDGTRLWWVHDPTAAAPGSTTAASTTAATGTTDRQSVAPQPQPHASTQPAPPPAAAEPSPAPPAPVPAAAAVTAAELLRRMRAGGAA